MARTTPVHTGYTILNGTGTGANGGRIDVWVEYKLGTQNVSGNYTPVTAYFYAALNPNYTASTSYAYGLYASFAVDGKTGTTAANSAYDFTSASKVNLLGSFSGNISHDADGTKKLTFAGSFTTLSSYISGGSVSKTVTLPAIPRASAVAASAATLGSGCCVSWTPALAAYSFTLTFSLGAWCLTTDRICPGTTEKVTYTAAVLPLEVARQFSGKTGTMTVALTTYSGDTALGTSTAGFTVTLPENQDTCPAVTAELTPQCLAFPDMYVQRLGKVQAEVTATDPLGAEITAVRITAGAVTTEGTVSDFLQSSGIVPVTVTAVSSRGFTGSWSSEIRICPYDSPRLTEAAAFRCLSDGTADPGGSFLRITATQSFSPVEGNNTGTLRWRIKPDGGSYGDWNDLTQELTADTGALAGVVLEKDVAYTVQVGVIDTVGSTGETTVAVPTEQVYMHRTSDAMGLGGYAEGSRVLDLHWDLRARRSVSGAYIRTLSPGKSFSVSFTDTDRDQQAALLLGGGVRGVIALCGAVAAWEGTDGVSLTAQDGVVTVTLPREDNGQVLILSPDPIEI